MTVAAPAPGVLEIKASYLQGQQILQNTFHVHKAGAWTPQDISDVIDAYVAWEGASAKGQRSNTCALAEVRAADLTSPTANYAARNVSPAIFGSRPSQNLPENVTLAVQAGTGKRGRGQQGRVFWIGLCEDQTDGSQMISGRADDIVGALNTLKDSLNGTAGGTMVTLHSRLNGAPLNPRTSTNIGTYGVSDLTTDSMRDRLPNHRRHKRSTP